jgi:hypothetical protein
VAVVDDLACALPDADCFLRLVRATPQGILASRVMPTASLIAPRAG